MPETPRTRLVVYSVAVLAPVVSLLVRWPLWPMLEDAVPHLTFFPAVMIAAYFGGFWPGLLATGLSAFAANYFLPRQSSFHFTSVKDVVALSLFVLVGVIISGLGELLHRARRRVVDITEHLRSRTPLRESEQRWRNLTEALPQFVWTASADGTADYFSTQITQYTGRAESELLAWGWMDVLHPDDRDRTRTIWSEAIANGCDHEVEHRIRGSDGAYRWFTTRGVPIRDTAGQIVKWFGTCTDITEHKRAEQALRESEKRFRGTFENAAVGIANVDFEGRWLSVNQRLCDIVGYTREELLQKTFQEITYPEDLASSLEKFIPFTQGKLPDFSLQKRYVRKDGSTVWVELCESLQRDETGRPLYVIVMIQDISERKRLEEELRESEQRWRNLTEALPQLVWTATPDGTCDYFSTQWTEHTGIPESRLLGWQWLETLHPDDHEPTRQLWTNSVAGLGPYDVEYRVRRKDGAYRWFKTRGVPIRNCQGRTCKWFGTCTDITESKLAAEELRLAKEAAVSANRAKDEFLANVSHEIRTPMNAIMGMTDLVLGTSLSDDQRQSLKTVKAAADNLLNILNDLLDFSKIEAGKLELDPADFSLRSALGDTLRTLAMRAHMKGLELVSHVQPDVPDALVGDVGRLRQVLLNLVGNAIKFTEEGEVVVRTEVAGAGLEEVRVHFVVSDTGIGIAAEKQEKIFRAFEQEDTSTTRKYGGTGLGLTIAARLVALMGGTIRVDSEPGRGSTFAFTAQFGRQPHPPERIAAGSPIKLDNLPVLIIDDNATNRRILEEWLRGWQMEPLAVGDGVAAMDTLWDAATRGRPYPLVLLDARMPDTDGLVLAARIRKRPELSATRIILLTSGDMPGNLARLRELRIDAQLLKPAQQDELLETIYQVMNRTKGDKVVEAAGRQPSGEPAPEGLRPAASTTLSILVAEDNDWNAQLLEQLLVQRGHRVRLASDGRKALSLAQAGTFDLLLLDVHMPELDGFQVIGAIRERERSAGGHLRVVALTARSRKEDRERCLAAGMDDFLAKPIQASDLWSAIDRVVGARGGLPADRTGPGLLDPRVLLAACGGDAGILEKICQAFRTRLPDDLAAVQDAMTERDAMRLREAAHKLCGMVAAFSTVAGGLASDLEDYAARGQLEEAQPLVGQLEPMAQELMRLVGSLSLEVLRQQTEGASEPNCLTAP